MSQSRIRCCYYTLLAKLQIFSNSLTFSLGVRFVKLVTRNFAFVGILLCLSNPLYAETYELTFEALWSATDHPTNFPAGSWPDVPGAAHYSPIIGASHTEAMTIWSSGEMASEGVENVAETGNRAALETMIDGSPNVLSKIVHPAGFATPDVTVGPLSFEVNDENPLVSFITMIAPSPDWFTGVTRLDLRDGDGFVDSLSVDLFAYDAGTEEGTLFATDNPDTDPQGMIGMVDQAALFGGTAPVGRATFTLIPEPSTGLLAMISLCGIAMARRRRESFKNLS